MVKIKLTQTGSKNRKQYRVVVMEESKRRDGKSIEILGFYNPLVKPAVVNVKMDRVQYWTSVGAQMTDGVKKLLESQKA